MVAHQWPAPVFQLPPHPPRDVCCGGSDSGWIYYGNCIGKYLAAFMVICNNTSIPFSLANSTSSSEVIPQSTVIISLHPTVYGLYCLRFNPYPSDVGSDIDIHFTAQIRQEVIKNSGAGYSIYIIVSINSYIFLIFIASLIL